MKDLIAFLQTFSKPPFLVLPKALKSTFLQTVADLNCFNPCQIVEEEAFFDVIDPLALTELSEYFGINYYLGMRILKVLPFVNNVQTMEFEKLSTLQIYKRHLIDKELVKLSNSSRFKNQDVLIAYHPSFSYHNDLVRIHQYNPNSNREQLFPILEVDNEELQVHAVIEKIYDLLRNGININQINIVNASSDDCWLLQKEALFYGFSIADNEMIPLDSVPLSINFISLLKELSIEEALKEINNQISFNSQLSQTAYQSILEIIQQYGLDYLERHPDLLIFLTEQKSIRKSNVNDVVRIIPTEEAFLSSDIYYFVMNYTDTLFPLLKRDDDYLRDVELQKLKQKTSIETNQCMIEDIKSRLNACDNITLLFPKKIKGNPMRKSDIIPNDHLKYIAFDLFQKTISGSKEYDYLYYQKIAYLANHYGKMESNYDNYQATFKDSIRQYTPVFKPLSKITTNQLLSKGFSFSPTNLERFNACRFRFLLDFLLKILKEDPSESILFGNIAHEILANIDSSSIEDIKMNFINKLTDPLSPKMKLHLDLFVRRLETVIYYLQETEKGSLFINDGTEIEYKHQLVNNPGFVMKGKIDRIKSYQENNKTYYAVIDFKTGNKKFSFDDFEKGIDIQPLFYLNLIKKEKQNQEMIPLGFFYQGVNIKRLNQLPNGHEIEKALKMNGVIISDTDKIMKFVPKLNITGLRQKNDGSFQAKKNLISPEIMDTMIASIDTFIQKAIKLMELGDYAINPIPGKNDFDDSPSCQYCPHAGVCFMANKFVKDNTEETEEDE